MFTKNVLNTCLQKECQIRRMIWREIRKAYKILVGKPEGKRSLGITRHRLGIILEWGLTCELDSSGSGKIQ
jgi:hypothetical protein